MSTFAVPVSRAVTDISAGLIAAAFTRTPPDTLDGRGACRLYNGSSNKSVYVLIQDTVPDDTSPPGLRVRPGEWFPQIVEIYEDAGVWCWSSGDVVMTALIISWS